MFSQRGDVTAPSNDVPFVPKPLVVLSADRTPLFSGRDQDDRLREVELIGRHDAGIEKIDVSL